MLARFALSFRPPTGFWREFVVEHSGERRGQLDLKHGGIIPIVDLARWAGMAAGVASAPTLERLRAAEAAGTMEGAEARTLMEAFGFIGSLRLDHQVEQLKRGSAADDFVDPKTLNPLARSYLREAFRAVASVQARLSAELPCAGPDASAPSCLSGGQAEPLVVRVDREDPDRDAGADRPGLLMRETGAALRLDERAERHLSGHYAFDDVTRLVPGDEFLPAHEDHLLPSRACACRSWRSLVVTGRASCARGDQAVAG